MRRVCKCVLQQLSGIMFAEGGYMSIGVIALRGPGNYYYKVRANIEEIKSWNISYFLIGIFCVQ